MRIDSHAHLIPASYRSELEARELLPYPLPPWSQDALEAFLDRYAIDAAIISLSPPGVWFGDAGLARELARIANEETARVVRANPQRFAGLAVLPLPEVGDALEELRYALDVLDLDGVALLSNVGGTYLGDERWDPVWDELEQRGNYVFIHPADPANGLAIRQHPVWLYEFPFDTTRAIVNLIYSGTLERCPHVRVQVAHLGGTVPFLAHRIASLAARDPAGAAAAPAGALHALSRLYYDTGLSNHVSAIEATRSVIPADRIVFGSDWPYLALPSENDIAADLDELGDYREMIDARNVAALVPRIAR